MKYVHVHILSEEGKSSAQVEVKSHPDVDNFDALIIAYRLLKYAQDWIISRLANDPTNYWGPEGNYKIMEGLDEAHTEKE